MHPAPGPARNDFNGRSTVRNPAVAAALLARLEHMRDTLDLAEAILAKDWRRAEQLYAVGADPGLRGGKALWALADCGDLEAAKLAEKMKDPSVAFIADLPLATAAGKGKTETVDYLLARGVPDNMVEAALLSALRGGQKDMADRLYGRLKHLDASENTLVEMLVHRPDLYAEATAARRETPDYITHFVKACETKDPSAIHRALDAMITHRGTFGPNIARHEEEFGIGMGHQEALTALLMTGDVSAMNRYYATFPELCPTNLEMFMVFALAVSPSESEVLRPIVENFRPDAKLAEFAFSYASQLSRLQSLEYLAETYPDIALKNSKTLLTALAAQKTPGAFFAALASGHTLPLKSDEKAELLAESLMSQNGAVAAHLEAEMLLTPAALLRLQAYHDLRVLKRAAELSGDWHFRDDILFWKALEQGDRQAVAAVPPDRKISTAQTSQTGPALAALVRRGDFDLLQLALERGDWTLESREEAFGVCLASADALKKFDFTRFPPRVLDKEDLARIAAGAEGGDTLKFLKSKGFTAPPGEALQAAVEKNALGMAEYLLARGANLLQASPALLEAIDRDAQKPMLALLEKWTARACDVPAPGLAALIEAAPLEALFAGTDSPAVIAAYAGKFDAVMKKAAAAGAGFDPALLASARDSRGNTLLDILGAHGRLNDVLAPEVWAGRDAAGFMRDNLPPCYRAQCDFEGLRAAIDLQRLKNRGKPGRLGFKGP